MAIEKSLLDRFVDLIQVPHETKIHFEGDSVDGEQLLPVKPTTVKHLPMTFQIIPPKIQPNVDAALNQNYLRFAQQNDTRFVGQDLVSSGEYFESIQDYSHAYQNMAQIEPLTLYINPTDITRSLGKRSQEQFGGGGHIVEHSGDEHDKLSCSGKIGATFTHKTGLTRQFRRNSASYQQLMHLFILYKNNGYLYEINDTSRISLVGSVVITYDSETWVGQFDAFAMSESADSPFTMGYSFEFTAHEYHNDSTLH